MRTCKDSDVIYKVEMRYFIIIIQLSFFQFFLSGCDMQFPVSGVDVEKSFQNSCGYVAAEVHIMGLTEIVPTQSTGEQAILKVYIDLKDSFGRRIKSPGVLRIEVYEFVPRSSDSRGGRLFIQPDLDINDPDENDKYWQDHLRTYRFDLPLDFVPDPGSAFIIEATFLPPGGKRLNGQFHLKYE